MTRPATLRAKNPADLLAMVPYLLGFHPEDSVVLVSLGAAGTPVHARQDLPADPTRSPRWSHDLARSPSAPAVDRVAWSSTPTTSSSADAVGRELSRVLGDAGAGSPLACVRADGERWYCLGDGDGSCRGTARPSGTPYDLARHPLTLEAVLDGRVRARQPARRSRDSLVGDDPDEVERGRRPRDRRGGRRGAPLAGPDRVAAPAPGRSRGAGCSTGSAGSSTTGGGSTATTSAGWWSRSARVEVRDVAWAQMSRADAARHVDLWRDVVRRSPARAAWPHRRPCSAFAAWLAGDGALAWCAVEREPGGRARLRPGGAGHPGAGRRRPAGGLAAGRPGGAATLFAG